MDASFISTESELTLTKQEFLKALTGPEFYIEWFVIGISIALAWMISALIRRRVKARLASHPPKHFDSTFITKPLKLLPPLLTLIYLGIARPFILDEKNGLWLDAVANLTVAYLLARCVTLLIRNKFISYLIATVILTVAVLNITGLLKPTTAYLDSVAFAISDIRLSLLTLAHGLIILVIVFWLANLISTTLESYLRRSSRLSYNARELTVKFFRIFIYFVAVIITLSAVGVDLTAFAVFGGALGVGIGLGLQQITSNFISGVTLLMEKSIKIGDLINVDDITGWVREMNVRYTLLELFDGSELMIPNEKLMSSQVTNWTHTNNRARVNVEVRVAYGSDVKLVRQLLLDAATEHPNCMKDPAPGCWLRQFGDSSLNFLLVFWVNDVREGRFGPQSDVMFTILEKFAQHGIEIPFPQRVLHQAKPPAAA